MTTPVEFDGTLEPDDLLKGNRLTAVRARSRQGDRWIGIAFGAAIGLLVAFEMKSLLATLAFIVLLMGFSFWQRWRVRALVTRRFQSRIFQVPFHSRLDQDGFRTTSSMFDDRRQWNDFEGWTEDAEHFVLFEHGAVFRVIPKRLVGGAAHATVLRLLLTNYIGPAR